MTESLWSTMNVRSPKPWDTRHGFTRCWHVFVFGFLNFISLMCVWLEKHYCIVYLYTQTSQIDYFHHVHNILRWIGSRLTILNILRWWCKKYTCFIFNCIIFSHCEVMIGFKNTLHEASYIKGNVIASKFNVFDVT